ncbi:MAG: hypothetical protein HY231_19885 [Acidobacteria bacterium]|nr:hypothetical protein [Acidobacteriota bacterium]
MRKAAIYIFSFIFAGAVALAPAPAKKVTIEQMATAIATAYEAKTLSKLDAEHPLLDKVKIIIEHSLAEDKAKDRFEIKEFKTLEQVEKWLKKRERDEDIPGRVSQPLLRCKNGFCTYDFAGGILHNQLYLKKIAYGYRNGQPYIKTIYLLDGD